MFEEGLYADTTLTHVLTHVLVKVKLPYAYCPHSPVYMREMCGVAEQMHGIAETDSCAQRVTHASHTRHARVTHPVSPSSVTKVQTCNIEVREVSDM